MKENVYTPIQQVRDPQPIRATCFHPSGETYVVGTNSKALKICKYPSKAQIQEIVGEFGPEDGLICEPEIAFTCLHIHRASVYCASFNTSGNLLATGSNDQIVHLIKYNRDLHVPEGSEYKLPMHNGTVRDVCFLPTADDSASRLLSAGGREFEIILTDCNVMKPKQAFTGHQATVMSLHCCAESENMFVSGGLDGAIKIWDVRCRESVCEYRNIQESPVQKLAPDGDTGRDISLDSDGWRSAHADQLQSESKFDSENQAPPAGGKKMSSEQHQLTTERQTPTSASTGQQGAVQGVAVGVVRLDQTGRLLVSGHHSGSCVLYDVRAARIIQSFKAHDGEIRTLNFSPKSYYLLTAGYDGKARLCDLQGQLNRPLPSVEVLEQQDKIVQCAWHPEDYNFVTTCADGSATLWTIPDFDEWRRDSLLADF